jgi:hypothetical protein
VESCQNIRLGMIGTQQYQEGFKAPYRGLPLKPPPPAVVVDSCHDFRHFYAVTEYQKDRDIHRVKDLLHHSSIEITDNYLRSLGAI